MNEPQPPTDLQRAAVRSAAAAITGWVNGEDLVAGLLDELDDDLEARAVLITACLASMSRLIETLQANGASPPPLTAGDAFPEADTIRVLVRCWLRGDRHGAQAAWLTVDGDPAARVDVMRGVLRIIDALVRHSADVETEPTDAVVQRLALWLANTSLSDNP